MDIFKKVYYKIINEEKFKHSKWKFDTIYKDIEIYFNTEHIIYRLKIRDPDEDIDTYRLIIFYLIEYLIENKIYESKKLNNKSDKFGLTRGFTFHEIISNSWICGTLQNDIFEHKYRLYFSTILNPKEHSHSTRDIFIEFEI